MNDKHKKTLMAESPEILEMINRFKQDYPNATEQQKKNFKEFLIAYYVYDVDESYAYGISDDDPFGILNDEFGMLNDYNADTEYAQVKLATRLNRKKKVDGWADEVIKDLLYRCALEKLAEQCVEIPPAITDEWDDENEAWWEGCIKAHTSPETANKPTEEHYIYLPTKDGSGYVWCKTGDNGRYIEVPDYIPPDDTKKGS